MASLEYPDVKRDESKIDNYHGTAIPDPYAWLEDPDCDETKSFVEAQNKVSMPYLEQSHVRERFRARLTELWDYPKYGCPFKRGDHYFYFYNTGLQNQSVLYMKDSLEGEGRVFLDPNKLSKEGTISLRGYTFSENGQYLAYGLSKNGSDWITIKFMEVDGHRELPDTLTNVKFSSMEFTHDHKGLFFNKYPASIKSDGTETDMNLNQKLYYHVLGTDQSEDVLCCEFPDQPRWMIHAEVTDCGNYVVLTPSEGCDPVNRLYLCDLRTLTHGITENLPYVKIVDNFDAEYEYIANEGTIFTFKTNLNAPRYKLINIDITKPQMENWTTLVAEHEKDVLDWCGPVRQDLLAICYMHDVKSDLQIHRLVDGSYLSTLPLEIGSIVSFQGRRKIDEIFYQFTSFLTPGIIYHCDMTEEPFHPRVYHETKVKGFEAENFITEQVFYPSKDGTLVPMFIVHRKGISLDGSHAVFLYGYGGFNISITPSFSTSRIIFIQHMRGILAVPNIRGGGEYGETWHKGGMLANKQNVFDDFEYAAKYLIDKKYTSPSKITINGGSNGGLLVGACVNQRPDLFKCAIAQVGVMDMLKFHKFTIGHAWTTDFGCSDKKDEFDWLIKYSPLHNIQIPENGVQYPAVLLLTADHDDRVVPLHSLKYIAQLQHVMGKHTKQTNPLLIRIDTKSGHGAGKPTAKVIEETADIYGFIAQNIGLEWVESSIISNS